MMELRQYRNGPGKRAAVAAIARCTGLLALLERLPRRASLIVVNYHRIGSPLATRYDRGVFAATAEQFATQMAWLKHHFHLATLKEAQNLIDDPSRLRQPVLLITLDDGYRDNYDVAFPILKSLGVPATFFLPSGLVGSKVIPWWDRIAELLRRTPARPLELTHPRPLRIAGDSEGGIRQVLRVYKSLPASETKRFLASLEETCGGSLQVEAPTRLFLDWSEAREMLAAGMSFGSHSHTHELLSQQTEPEQHDEALRSRDIIRKNLGIACDALAYPVGSPSSFSGVTRNALRAAGYRTAFSSYGGINLPPRIDPFNVLRIPIDMELGLDGYRLRALVSATTGRQWP